MTRVLMSHNQPGWESWGVHTLALDVLKGWVGFQPLGAVLVCGIVAGLIWYMAYDWLRANFRQRMKKQMKEMARRDPT